MDIARSEPMELITALPCNKNDSVRAASRKSRVYVFRQFIIETYRDYMTEKLASRHARQISSGQNGIHESSADRSGNNASCFHVLDVAGGNGDLSWLLTNVHEPMSTSTTATVPVKNNYKHTIPIQSTVVDPRGRTPKCHHIVKSVRYLQQHPEERARRAVFGRPSHQPLALLIEQGKIGCPQPDDFNSNTSNGNYGCANTNVNNVCVIDGAGDNDDFQTPHHITLALNAEFVTIIQNFHIVKLKRKHNNRRKHIDYQQNNITNECTPVIVGHNEVGEILVKTTTTITTNDSNNYDNLFDDYEFQNQPLSFITMDELNEWRTFFHRQHRNNIAVNPDTKTKKRKPANDDARSDYHHDILSATMSTCNDDADKALELVLKSDLICGFHPDQATDSCIDLADALGVPFCIVPCCVFPAEFPDRRLFIASRTADIKDTNERTAGERVRTYNQLLQYLQQKCPQARRDFLGFSFAETAKNVVLYT